MATPEHRARQARHGRRRGDEDRRRSRRHHRVGSSASRRRHGEAEQGARRLDRSAGLDDATAKAPLPPSSPTKRPRLRSEVGLVRGCPWRFEPFNPHEGNAVDAQAADGVAMAPTSSSSPVAPADKRVGAVLAPEAAPAKEGAYRRIPSSSSSTVAPPPLATTTGVLFACQLSVPALPLSSSSHGTPQALGFTAAASQPMPASSSIPCPKRMKAIASTSRPAYAIPAIPPFPMILQGQQDADELRRAKLRQRYAGLIAKTEEETAERYRKLLRSGQAPPEPEPPKPVVDEETLRRTAAMDAARKRSREALAQEERKAQGAALFVQMACPEHMRELGIDKAMKRVVSPERPRDGNGAPVLSPEYPCSPVEKLGYFLKAE